MSEILAALRAAVRPQTPPMATTPPEAAERGLPGASRRLSVGPWVAPGSAPGDWGALAPGCNHPHEADAIVTLCEMRHGFATSTAPVALLRRRLHPVQAGDPDAHYLRPVALYELLSPGGRDYLTAMLAETLLEELSRRLGGCQIVTHGG